jgi:hypothetical protein
MKRLAADVGTSPSLECGATGSGDATKSKQVLGNAGLGCHAKTPLYREKQRLHEC